MATATFGPARSGTHWSLIRAAGDAGSPGHRQAFEQLALRYWYPLYAFARRQGASPEDAGDLTQGFLSRFLQQDVLGHADPARGRFRTFILTCFKNHIVNERNRARALRRGGGSSVVALDAVSAESRYRLEPRDDWSPDQVFDRQWALATLERALVAVRAEYSAAGREVLHDALRSVLWDEVTTETYAQLGARLGMTEAAVKMAVVRLRRRCRLALADQVARTVRRTEDVAYELEHLIAVLRSG